MPDGGFPSLRRMGIEVEVKAFQGRALAIRRTVPAAGVTEFDGFDHAAIRRPKGEELTAVVQATSSPIHHRIAQSGIGDWSRRDHKEAAAGNPRAVRQR